MARFIESFVGPHQGRHDSLDALLARVREVCDAVSLGRKLTPFRATRWDWVSQDLGYRLLTVHAHTSDRGVQRALDDIIDSLAARRTALGVRRTLASYEALSASVRRPSPLPSPADVFATGYALTNGYGSCLPQLEQGIRSALPGTCDALGVRRLRALIPAFASDDRPERRGIGKRFAAWLSPRENRATAELAAAEAAITHAPAPDSYAVTLDGRSADLSAPVRLSPSVSILRLDHAVLEVAPRKASKLRPRPSPRFVAVSKNGEGEVDLIELPTRAAHALSGSREVMADALGLDDDAISELLERGVLLPCRYLL
jgi:hypothetical protein